MTDDDRTDDVESALRSYGINVERIDGDDPLELTYMTAFPALNALIDRAEADAWDPVTVDGTVIRSPGDVLGTWRAEAEWFDALIAYEISETEFSTRVLETLTHADGDGEHEPAEAGQGDGQ